jgi:UDP-N-acetylglucosamine--N-acetylmuramyl-(pentapeptide) pyrophosphoryl-undecaprenol N-acetylglucosamine transferase
LSELAAARKPAILVPLPTAADNHQQKNAEIFAATGAARVILQKDLNVPVLTRHLEEFLRHPRELETMAQAAGRFFVPHAAQDIVAILSGD